MKSAMILTLVSALLSQLAIAGSVVDNTFELKRQNGSTISYYLDETVEGSISELLLIVLQGSDCNSVKHDRFINAHAKEIWPQADLLRVEKPGITHRLTFSANPERPDCPREYIQYDNPTQRFRDLASVVEKVLERRKYQHLVVVGGSEGAVVAAMFAAQFAVTDAVVLINGGGRWFLDDVLYSIEKTSKGGDGQAALQGFKGFADQVLKGEPFPVEMSNHGYGWWRDALSIDLQSTLGKVSAPVLVVQGNNDEAVSPSAVRAMVDTLRKEGKEHIEMRIYPQLDHGLMAPNGHYEGDQVVADINVWLKSKLLPRSDQSE